MKFKKRQKIKLDFVNKKILVFDSYGRRKQNFNLPKNLIYTHTLSTFNKRLNIKFTKNGNIKKSFSIYIFNSRKNAKFKISFYGFDRSKFLKINTYKRASNKKIKLEDIDKYHELTNDDRKLFFKDWKKE